MTLDSSHRFRAPRDRVWAAFTDPGVLARATPGCTGLTPVGMDEFEATLEVGVTPVRGVYSGRLAILDKHPLEGYTLQVEGSGRPGFVKGHGQVTLSEERGGTRVRIRAEAQVGGVIAAVGPRLLGAAGRLLMGQFFSALEAEIGKAHRTNLSGSGGRGAVPLRDQQGVQR